MSQNRVGFLAVGMMLILGVFGACNPAAPGRQVEQSGGATFDSGSGHGNSMTGGEASVSSGGGATVLVPPSGPLNHPPSGFESCIHAEVKKDCELGWCKLPPSCFVMGAPKDEWHRGRYTEIQTQVVLTHSLEVQQMEMSRAEWKKITSVLPSGYKQDDDGECLEDNCPINNITWWEAIHAANLVSERQGFDPCYAPVNCTGQLGQGLTCEAVAEPEKSVYECRGYRLATRAEAEYAARAGTVSDFYTGNLTVYDNNNCNFDVNLDKAGWYCFNSANRAHAGGTKQSNGFGLFDTLGNVGEWLGEADRTTQAQGGTDPSGGVGTLIDRMIYGGMYNSVAYICDAASLFAASWDFRGYRTGFRLYRTLFEDSERSQAIVSE